MGNPSSYISVVLLPTEADTQELIALSQAINEARPSSITLGENVLPHVTIAQFEAPAEQTAKLWDQVRHLSSTFGLTAAGLNFRPNINNREMWVEILLLKTAELAALQSAVLQTDFAREFQLHNGSAERFRPHTTLALYKDFRLPSFTLGETGVETRLFEDLKLAVGLNGPNFTFVESQYS